jgi:hypothetical protein
MSLGKCCGILTALVVCVVGSRIVPLSAQEIQAQRLPPELVAKGAWSATTTYAIDDIVTARGSTWRSLKAANRNRPPGQTQPSTAAYWEPLASGLNPTGAWVSTTKYQPNDLAISNGSTWRAKRTNLNKAPIAGANWEQFAAQGLPGAQGPAGPNNGIGAGTQSVPAISFNGDTDTGIYSPSAGKIAMVENGSLFLHNLGTHNTAFGMNALSINTGVQNTAIGDHALESNTNAINNTAVGNITLQSNSTGYSNTAVGSAALTFNTTGDSNVGVGDAALTSNLTGRANTAVGAVALSANNVGVGNTGVGYAALAHNKASSNTAVGAAALTENTTGTNNSAVGDDALRFNVDGRDNTALGTAALQSNTSGYQSSSVGSFALQHNTTGYNNSAFGYLALYANTTGFTNAALGNHALTSNTTGSGNTATGSGALYHNTQGASNTGFGQNALFTNALGIDNVAIGSGALYNTYGHPATDGPEGDGSYNTAVGHAALQFNTQGSHNVAVGFNSLSANTTGSNNIALGNAAGGKSVLGSNSIYIGNEGASSDNKTIKIGTPGTQTSTFIAAIRGVTTLNNNAVAVMVDSAGQLGTVSSSRRYKYDIETMADASAMLTKLRPVTFRYKQVQDKGAHPLQYGLIAEEVADVFPDLVVLKDGKPETVKYHLLPTFLLAGYQAQQKAIATQAQEIADLKQRLRAMEAQLPTRAAALH